jgi:hypothetical protein
LLSCHQITPRAESFIVSLDFIIVLVEQYLSKYDFDGEQFTPLNQDLSVNFGNVEVQAPKTISVKP